MGAFSVLIALVAIAQAAPVDVAARLGALTPQAEGEFKACVAFRESLGTIQIPVDRGSALGLLRKLESRPKRGSASREAAGLLAGPGEKSAADPAIRDAYMKFPGYCLYPQIFDALRVVIENGPKLGFEPGDRKAVADFVILFSKDELSYPCPRLSLAIQVSLFGRLAKTGFLKLSKGLTKSLQTVTAMSDRLATEARARTRRKNVEWDLAWELRETEKVRSALRPVVERIAVEAGGK
jgi:hypothetical protein